jgi:ElaB/YqjD/DUF883 family membrane-anchored ribosome-binding protein
MSTTSSASNIRDAARETASDAREGLREVGKAASAASDDIQKDLQALRDDLARLAQQVGAILSDKGSTAWERAKSSAQSSGKDAADAMREVSDKFVDAVDESVKERPYTTLAIAAGLGFLFGATWRR